MTGLNYRSPRAFKQAADEKLRRVAKERKRPMEQLAREFLFQRFMARIFYAPTAWVVKGGASLLVRLPHARHSKDIDLVRAGIDPFEAARELRELGRRDLGDYLSFELGDPEPHEDEKVKIHATAYVGASTWAEFTIDLSTRAHFVAEPEKRVPSPVIDIVGLDLPEFVLYPLTDQIADKVCAMYELTRGGNPSGRYRDLVDLILLTDEFELDAAALVAAIQAQRVHRTRMVLPNALQAPAAAWATGYARLAAGSRLPLHLHALDAALAHAAACLDPILSGQLTSGRWIPVQRRWAPAAG